MAKFNIQYADRPVNVRSTAAMATPDTATYQALAQVGQAITGIGAELQQQKNALDYSEGQRRISEQVNSAMESLTGDEENDSQIWDKLQQNIGGIEYKSRRVNNALEIYRNQAMPNIEQEFTKRHQGLLRQNIHDQFEAEGQTFLAQGDLVSYQEILDRRLATKDISMAEYTAKTETALSDSLLQQARDLLASDSGADHKRAIGMLENMGSLTYEDGTEVKFTTEQKEYKNKLLKLAKKTSQEKEDATISSVVIQKDNLKDAPVLEKQAAAAKMKQELVNGGVAGDKLNQWFGILDKWSGGDKDATEQYDPKIYAGLQATCDLKPQSITEGQIYSFVGQGKDGGITIQQARNLAELRQRNIDDVGKIQNEFHRRYQDILKGMYNSEVMGTGPEAATHYAEIANRLTIFANTNKDATAQEYEKFFADLTADTQKQSWFKIGASWLPPFSYFKSLGRAGKGRAVFRTVDEEIKRITAVRERIQTQAWQRRQQRQIGREVVHNGQRWRLDQLGNTPDQDVYVRVE